MIISPLLFARSYHVNPGEKVMGSITHAPIKKGQHNIDVAEHYDIGFDNLIAANPHIPTHKIRPGTQFLLPTEYILPNVRTGVVINLPEKRLYYFDNQQQVHIFPVAIGRLHHNSMPGVFKITEKRANPTWHVPVSVLKEEKLKGNHLPAVMEPGPENPLGNHAIRLSHGPILIHGTNFPPSIGKRSTSGCFGMYPDDIEKLFSILPNNTPVTVINEPIKIAHTPEGIYIESHPTLAQTNNHGFRKPSRHEILENIDYVLKNHPHADPLALYAIFSQNMGIPILLGKHHAHHLRNPRRTHRY